MRFSLVLPCGSRLPEELCGALELPSSCDCGERKRELSLSLCVHLLLCFPVLEQKRCFSDLRKRGVLVPHLADRSLPFPFSPLPTYSLHY